MRTLSSWSFAALLALGSVLPASAQPASLQDALDQSCQHDLAAVVPDAHAGHSTVATVIQVDHQRGLLHLDTDHGRLLLAATPEDIKDLQEGDQLPVCIAGADQAETLSNPIPAS
jgi:hypothetical protein